MGLVTSSASQSLPLSSPQTWQWLPLICPLQGHISNTAALLAPAFQSVQNQQLSAQPSSQGLPFPCQHPPLFWIRSCNRSYWGRTCGWLKKKQSRYVGNDCASVFNLARVQEMAKENKPQRMQSPDRGNWEMVRKITNKGKQEVPQRG